METRLQKFPLLTAEEIEHNASRRDGVSTQTEAKYWKKIGKTLFGAVQHARLQQYVVSALFECITQCMCVCVCVHRRPPHAADRPARHRLR